VAWYDSLLDTAALNISSRFALLSFFPWAFTALAVFAPAFIAFGARDAFPILVTFVALTIFTPLIPSYIVSHSG